MNVILVLVPNGKRSFPLGTRTRTFIMRLLIECLLDVRKLLKTVIIIPSDKLFFSNTSNARTTALLKSSVLTTGDFEYVFAISRI